MAHTFECTHEGRPLTSQTGMIAGQANGAVTVRFGDTVILVTACISPTPREDTDFFPLTVDFEERLYAAGRIPGSFFRREGRPTEEAILSGRLIDRLIRPLFPKGLRNDVQIVCTVLSVDRENPPDVLSIVGASAALAISDIPFEGPVGGCRVAALHGGLVVNPTFGQLAESTLNLVVAGTRDAVVMIEADGREAPEELVLRAVERGQEANRDIIRLIEEMARAVGKQKLSFPPPVGIASALLEKITSILGDRLRQAVFSGVEKSAYSTQLGALKEEVAEALGEGFSPKQIGTIFDTLVAKELREGALQRGARPDGRGLHQLRPLSATVSLLPRTHGSGLFSRGETQVLTIATLGSLGEQQKLDTLSPEESKRFLHHYNFPPFSTGEVRRLGSSGRREIGHGALAERSLEPVIPSEEEFPYTIRLVSEVLSSNGSTSMASVCGSTLALMDAGVPVKAPVAGVAMGLLTGADGRYRVLTDIQGLEDQLGDMDFKVAGTTVGITALQLDTKLKGLPPGVLEETLARAREARLEILGTIRQAIAEARPNLSPFAPRILKITVPVDKIGAVIGPGGKTIRGIIEKTKATIDIEDDGSVLLGSPNEESLLQAKAMVEALVQDVEVGGIYTGKVTRIAPFGAFVEVLPGKDGLVPVGELGEGWVNRVEDVVKIGDEITVVVTEIDRMGRINLSRRALLQKQEAPPSGTPPPERGPGGADAGPRPAFPRREERGSPRFGQGPGGHGGPRPGLGRGPRPPFRGDQRPGYRPPPPGER
ncbi:MAG: polyribonucleotide nucleotidyltransferase [Chloroflexi bacterium]|nr:polyribonucleotide nucleotidyltransferase [Chloroflexota bacterium]